MESIVIDASVLVALYLDEPATASARKVVERLNKADAQLHAPDLLLVEFAHAMSKRVRRSELSADDARTALSDLLGLKKLLLHPMDGPVIREALALALANDLSAYDATYVALAIRLRDGIVLSGDRRLVSRGRESNLPVVEPSEFIKRL